MSGLMQFKPVFFKAQLFLHNMFIFSFFSVFLVTHSVLRIMLPHRYYSHSLLPDEKMGHRILNSVTNIASKDRVEQGFEPMQLLGAHWKDWCWSWNSNTLATSCEELTHWKRPWCWEGLGAGREGDDRGWDGWIASLTRWTWVWVNPGVGDGQGGLAFCDSWGRKVGHDWATELNWIQLHILNHGTRSGCCFEHIFWFEMKLMIVHGKRCYGLNVKWK